MGTDIEKSERQIIFNVIVEDYILKGENNATKIAKSLGIKRADVVLYQEQWRDIAQNDEGVKARANELLTELDRSYDQIVAGLWNAHSDAVVPKDQAGILKTIAEVIAKRQEVLQKAGLYDDAALGDQMALVEEQAQKIKELLTTVSNNPVCPPELRHQIIDGLGKIFGVPQASAGGMS